ncbi:MAG: hypothetical protein HOI23_03635 [Deltaproteobacteria bacterium]|nr:hypothetical protein [Deltaproteobacteria bacterium]
MKKALFFLCLFVSSSWGCGTQSSSGIPEGELPFPPETVLGVSTIEAYQGNLEVTMAAAGVPCGSRIERKSYGRQAMIRISLVAVDQGGSLVLVASPGQDAEQVEVPSINGFAAFLVSDQGSVNDLEVAHNQALVGSGTVSLDVVPNYDTGRALGRYDLSFGDHRYSGTFDASYCARDVSADLKVLAWDLMTWCGVSFEAPLQPGSLWTNAPLLNTLGRDLGRGLKAEGVDEEEISCLGDAVDYCQDNLTDWEAVFGDEPTLQKCRAAFARRCLQYNTDDLEQCETMMVNAGLVVPTGI